MGCNPTPTSGSGDPAHTEVDRPLIRFRRAPPVLDSARLLRQFGMLLQPRLDGRGVAEHERGVESRLHNAGMEGENTLCARRCATGRAADEFVHRGRE